MRVAAAFALILAIAPALAADTKWVKHYEDGVRLLEEGNHAEAQKALRAALEARPAEQLSLEVEKGHYIDYLPHLYLTIASYELGDAAAAKQHLKEAEKTGLAARSEEGA